MKSDRVLSVVIPMSAALLATAAAIAGVFFRGDGNYVSVTSVRGETYDMAVNGVYANNALRVVAEGVGWDIFTLAIAVPALLFTLPGVYRNAMRARLFAIGILGYLSYQYLMYALTWAFGPLFLLFIAVQTVSLVALVYLLARIDLPSLAAGIGKHFPARGMALLSGLMALLLTGMWVTRILEVLKHDSGPELFGMTTMTVQALDLGIVVPLALFTAVLAWRRRPSGYLLCSVVVVKSFAMAAAICAMLLSAWAVEGAVELPPLIIFAAAAVASAWLGARMYANIGMDIVE
ncbi:MAG: hypothetical protein M5R41_06190 [Bacteroidia bacterium]|nr:hypothetical protein [Bacteroidia bacterium]